MTKKIAPNASTNFVGSLTHPHAFVRSVRSQALLEDFFVSAVTSMLAIRLYLQVTGFPQVTIGSLHIAHMLWGGLFMLIALAILLAFLDHNARLTAAIVGGIGFGAFIDELGKLITRENDYFFQPAVAIIYVLFVLIFFATRILGNKRSLSDEACLANAFEIAKQGTLTGLDEEERDHAMDLLEKCPSGAVRNNLEAILQNTLITPSKPSRLVVRLHKRLDIFYRWAVTKWWFSAIIVIFFTLTAVTSLYALVAVVQWSWGLILWVITSVIMVMAMVWSRRVRTRYLVFIIPASIIIVSILISWAIIGNLKGMPLTIIDWAKFIFPGTSGVLIVMGILALPRSRLQAYLMFRRSILVSIFLTQVMSFYEQQFLALLGLIPNILILLGLRYLITHEEMKKMRRATEKSPAGRSDAPIQVSS